MKIEVKKIDAVRRELKFEVPRERVLQKFDEVYQEFGKIAKVKGFRPGKVPRHILESQHGKMAEEEVAKKLIPEVYQEGIAREKIMPIDLPEILDVHFREGAVTFTAKLDVKPEVKVSDYKGIQVKRKSSSVGDDEINKTLELFRKQQGLPSGSEHSGQEKGAAEGAMSAVDDAFARGLGFPSLEELRKSLSRQLEMEKDRQNRLDLENQIVEHLLKKSKLVTPQSLVNKQFERRLDDIKYRLKSQGLSEEEIKKKEEEAGPQLREVVEKDVRVYLIFDRIAELENIEVKGEENLAVKVMEFLLKEAKWEEAK